MHQVWDLMQSNYSGPNAGTKSTRRPLGENDLSLGAVGTGAGKVLNGLSLTDQSPSIRAKAITFIHKMIDFGSQYNAPAIIGSMQGSYTGEVSKSVALKWLGTALEELDEHASNEVSLITNH